MEGGCDIPTFAIFVGKNRVYFGKKGDFSVNLLEIVGKLVNKINMISKSERREYAETGYYRDAPYIYITITIPFSVNTAPL